MKKTIKTILTLLLVILPLSLEAKESTQNITEYDIKDKIQEIYGSGFENGYMKGFQDGNQTATSSLIAFTLLVLIEENREQINETLIQDMFSLASKLSDCINKNGDSVSQDIAHICKKEISIFMGNTNLYLSEMNNYWNDMVKEGMNIQKLPLKNNQK